jgi:lysophosphatidylcholine acyltransferase/lyso-PAF acetyltransferase
MNARHIPFVRDDQYGEGGLAPQPLSEQLRIALMALLVVPFKVLGTICCILFVFTSCKIASLLPPSISHYLSTGAGKLGARLCLLSLGFWRVEWVRHSGGGGDKEGQQEAAPAVAIVSNHVSWMDILVHMSHSFPSFVARDGTQNLPLIGVVRWGAPRDGSARAPAATGQARLARPAPRPNPRAPPLPPAPSAASCSASMCSARTRAPARW